MLHKTRGIVLSYIKYKETSIIVKIYTEKFGLQSYLINSIRSSKSKKGLALVQPLTLLEMVVYQKAGNSNGLQRISEYKPAVHFSSIPFEINKSSLALFISELLNVVLKDEEHHGGVFEFLFRLIIFLDNKTSGYNNVHIFLMVQLTHYLGFGIHNIEELEKHIIVSQFATDYESIYKCIMSLNILEIGDQYNIDNALRRDVLNYMIQYYILHIEGFKPLKSLDVLSQIFK
ncbi:DNA repair protein RecO [Reichenbachiella versicolor]|uniref:DNA repair protein RecO n=1 Tax=Reichenbachiella versicolor TaxID=1821036 RepID=UPI000D6E2A92|nr:DNA repair protein RecO [Reichenbachiella versicolor]